MKRAIFITIIFLTVSLTYSLEVNPKNLASSYTKTKISLSLLESKINKNIVDYFLLLPEKYLSYGKDYSGIETAYNFNYNLEVRIKLLFGGAITDPSDSEESIFWEDIVIDLPNGYISFNESFPPGGDSCFREIALFKSLDKGVIIGIYMGYEDGVLEHPKTFFLTYTNNQFVDITKEIINSIDYKKMFNGILNEREVEYFMKKAIFGFRMPRYGKKLRLTIFTRFDKDEKLQAIIDKINPEKDNFYWEFK